MGYDGRPLFDLNEPPTEVEEEINNVVCLPQIAIPSLHSQSSDLFINSVGSQTITNNFSHASSVSGFHPFVCLKSVHSREECDLDKLGELSSRAASYCSGEEARVDPPLDVGSLKNQYIEREEGEWSDTEDATGDRSMHVQSKVSGDQAVVNSMDKSASILATEDVSTKINNPEITFNKNNRCASSGSNSVSEDHKSNNLQILEGFIKIDQYLDGQMEPGLNSKSREVKGVEASHAIRCGHNLGKRHKHDHHKELMRGKKRTRQTMFLNFEDVKQAGPIKTSYPRRQNIPAPITSRVVKENNSTSQLSEPAVNDQKQVEISSNLEEPITECSEPKHECNSDTTSGVLSKPGRLNDATDLSAVSHQAPLTENSWKRAKESMQLKNGKATKKTTLINQISRDTKMGNKKFPPRKPLLTNAYYPDSSVERLIREVTNEKFWHHPVSRSVELYELALI